MQHVQIELDGKPHAVPSGTTLAGLMESLSTPADSVATAVNGEFVARDQRSHRPLRTNDAVLVFRAIVGG